MSVTLALIEYLRSQGMTAEQIVDAVAAMERAKENDRWAHEVPPSTGAIRQRRYRDRLASRVTSQPVTGDVTGDAKESPPTPPKENNTPPEEPIGSSTPKRSKGTRLPDGWLPPDALIEFGQSLGFSESATRAELERMADYFRGASGQRGVKRDWVATGRNWLRTAAERKGVAPTGAPQGSGSAGKEIRVGDPSWDAWMSHYRDGGLKFSVKTMQQAADAGKPFAVPSEWPPGARREAA